MKRTPAQQASIEVYCRHVAEQFVRKDYDMVYVLKHKAIDVPWTQDNVKDIIFKDIEFALFGKVSTRQLEKMEVSMVYDVMNRWLIDKFSISVPFPSEETRKLGSPNQ